MLNKISHYVRNDNQFVSYLVGVDWRRSRQTLITPCVVTERSRSKARGYIVEGNDFGEKMDAKQNHFYAKIMNGR